MRYEARVLYSDKELEWTKDERDFKDIRKLLMSARAMVRASRMGHHNVVGYEIRILTDTIDADELKACLSEHSEEKWSPGAIAVTIQGTLF